MSRKKARIGLLCHRTLTPNTLRSLWPLRGDFVLDVEQGNYHQSGRNAVAMRLREPYLLFVDADMEFPPQAIDMLFDAIEEHPEMGAISGCYMSHGGTCRFTHSWKVNGNWMSGTEVFDKSLLHVKEGVVVPVDRFGAGLLLIRKEVFDRMEYPWFHIIQPSRPTEEAREMVEPPMVGEDTYFCVKMKANGWKPCVHFGVPVGHVGPQVWHPLMFERDIRVEV